MADHYLTFSEVLPRLTDEEERWLQEQLQPVYVFGDKEYAEDAISEDLDPGEADWSGCRAWRDLEDLDPDDGETVGFAYDFHDDHDARDGWGRHLWFCAEEHGDVTRVAHLVQRFLKQFRPNQCWSLTYATTCSKPRAGEFGGGAVFVTADETKWQNAYDFLEQEERAFQAASVEENRSSDANKEQCGNLAPFFRCPSCGGRRIEEILEGAVVASHVEHVTSDGDLEYGGKDIQNGTVDRYQCQNCGYALAGDSEKLVAVLREMARLP